MSHVDRDDLLRYRIDRSLVDGARIEAHVTACEPCARELALIDAEDAALRDAETWALVDAVAAPRSARLQEASDLRRRIERENESARRALTPLLRPSLRLAEAKLAENPAFCHAGTVRVLCEIARDYHERKPVSALEAATEAYRVACALAPGSTSDRRHCMAVAQRERGTALRYLGRLREALQALEEAEGLFDQNPAADAFDIAIVNLRRAFVLVDLCQFAEAASCAGKARQVFHEYADTARELSASMVEARCLLDLGSAENAAELCETIIRRARREGDTAMLARGLLNAGVAHRRARHFVEAEERYFEAIPLLEELGLTTEVARANLQVATLTAERGELPAAIPLLDASSRELAAAGMTNDAAVATLRWAEVCLALGIRQGVADKCRRLVVVFESQGVERRARLALAYLQEALHANTATPAIVAEVREYLEALPREPERAFVPSLS